MDVFGELWADHDRRMAEQWDAVVSEDDTVLLPGDLSWGRNLEEARPDLDWIGSRPGHKVLLRGNHDGWWTGIARVKKALPDRCALLQNDAIAVGDRVVVGARGWTHPDDPWAKPGDDRVFQREVQRLRLSIEVADRRFGRQAARLAMVHYPPCLVGSEPTVVEEILRDGGVETCVYGHLHGEDHKLAVEGERGGIRYRFVAADAVGFRPVEIATCAVRSLSEES